MKTSSASFKLSLGLFSLLAFNGSAQEAADRHFEQEIRPLLIAHCLECHGSEKQKGGLRLDSREALLSGGESGNAFNQEDPSSSLLLKAIRYEDLEMPPKAPLEARQIEQLEKWILAGAPWSREVQLIREERDKISDKDREWWAFQPVGSPKLPPSQSNGSSQNPIDQFVLAKLKEHQIEAAPEAKPGVLLRRAYFTLLGLPPNAEETEQFETDPRPDKWARLVERLLADPRYGEHWTRYWLDLVRYSDSDGWNQDAFRPHIWRYRDYVINAFNADKPYPDFVKEQLAGDEVPEDNPEALTATGFLRLGIYEYNQRDARGHWNDIMNETTDVAGDVFLGMSMACARCHDHKFDPVLQKDYFKLRSFFEPLIWRDDLKVATQTEHQEHANKMAIWKQATKSIQDQIDALLKPYYDKKWVFTVDKFPLDIQACFNKPVEERSSLEHQMAYLVSRQFLEEGGGPLKNMTKEDKATHEALKKELVAFDHLKPPPLPSLMAASDFEGSLSPTIIPDDPQGEPISPGFLTVLSSEESSLSLPQTARGSGRRTALAAWIGSDDNPLTPRVMVNRIWQQHFGEGLVRTPNDFGHNGERPSHPELLDWLTRRFIDSGWQMKALHRLILNSATWKQSSENPRAEAFQKIDPNDTLLWRFQVRRLRAEQIRDAMLSASGELEQRIGGPSRNEDEPSRALYMKQFRNRNDTFLHAFDLGGGLKSVAVRNTTTTPTQSLIMINGDYAIGRARSMAKRLTQEIDDSAPALVREAIRRTWGRNPTPAELERSLAFLEHPDSVPSINQDRLTDFCHVLFNSNEFLYLD